MALFCPFSQIKNMKKFTKILSNVILFWWATALFLCLFVLSLLGLKSLLGLFY